MDDPSPNFMNDSLNESNFDLPSSLQDHFDRVENLDLISDTSSVRTSNSFSRMGHDMMPMMGDGLSPKSSQKTFMFNKQNAIKSNVPNSMEFKKIKTSSDGFAFDGKRGLGGLGGFRGFCLLKWK